MEDVADAKAWRRWSQEHGGRGRCWSKEEMVTRVQRTWPMPEHGGCGRCWSMEKVVA
jgi:hypothetical protein